jgi:hypothetical protein
MARIAVGGGVILGFSVAIHAPTHGQRCKLFYAFHFLNFAVTNCASDTFINMPLVIEKGELRQIMHFDPGNRFTFAVRLHKGLNVGTVSLYDKVTIHTNIHRRHSGMTRTLNRGMAIHTWDLIFAGMSFVAKWKGLNRGIPLVLGRRKG